jgi:hypothetical protein
MNSNTRLTQTFIGAMVLAATICAVYAGSRSHIQHSFYALALLALAAATSRMKVKLPGIEGNMSVNLPFLLMAVISLSSVEAILIASVSTAVQCWPKSGGKLMPEQMVFNVSMMAFAASLATLIWNSRWLVNASLASRAVALSATTATFFLGQTVPVAAIITLTQGTAMRRVWMSIVQMSFPYYVVSVGVTSMLTLVSHQFGWQAAVVLLPVMYGIHQSYRLYFGSAAETLHTAPMSRAASAG